MVTSQWRERWEVWREKRKVRVFGKGKCKLIEFWQRERVNSSPILARQWWRHFRLSLYLSLSLSLSPNVPHAQYRKRFRASYNKKSSSTCMCTGFSVTYKASSCSLFPLFLIPINSSYILRYHVPFFLNRFQTGARKVCAADCWRSTWRYRRQDCVGQSDLLHSGPRTPIFFQCPPHSLWASEELVFRALASVFGVKKHRRIFRVIRIAAVQTFVTISHDWQPHMSVHLRQQFKYLKLCSIKTIAGRRRTLVLKKKYLKLLCLKLILFFW